MANRKSKKDRQKRKRQTMRKQNGGSDFNVPIRAFYPQNSFEHDPSRQMATSVIKGGKKHSRKYLHRGGFYTGFNQLNSSPVQNLQINAYKV